MSAGIIDLVTDSSNIPTLFLQDPLFNNSPPPSNLFLRNSSELQFHLIVLRRLVYTRKGLGVIDYFLQPISDEQRPSSRGIEEGG